MQPTNTPSSPLASIKPTIQKFWLENGGLRIPFGVGCAWLGQGYPDREQVRDRLLTLETTYELGFRYYDTARSYGDSEWVVGEFIPTVPRESIFLATKFRLPKTDDPAEAVRVARTCLEESLLRLKAGYLDLYQVHDSTTMELVFTPGGVLDFLVDARRQGFIRHIGMAIRDQATLERAVQHEAFSTILTWGEYSPFNQDATGLIERARRRGMGVINGSPLYDARRRGLDFADPRVLAAVLQYPLRNPGIDMTLTGPSNRKDILSTLQALHTPVDPALWEEWKQPI